MEGGNVDVVDLDRNTHQRYFGEGLVASIAAAAGTVIPLLTSGLHCGSKRRRPGNAFDRHVHHGPLLRADSTEDWPLVASTATP